MNLTRREFVKVIGSTVFYLAVSGCISKLSNVQINNKINENMQTFSVTIIHSFLDTDNGKEFSISNFPLNCIIKEIRIRSNFTSGQQNWRVAFVDNPNGISLTDTDILCRTAEIFETGDYIFKVDEIAYVNSLDNINNIISVKRGVKGSVPMYHNFGTRMENANNGLRLILSKDRNYRLDESLNIYDIDIWKGNSISPKGDKQIHIDQIKNIKNMILYI